VTLAGTALLANLCIGTSVESNELRALILAEGAHELVLSGMAFFEKKSPQKGELMAQTGLAFLQNLTAGDGGHRPRQLLMSERHLDLMPRFAEIMEKFSAGNQVRERR